MGVQQKATLEILAEEGKFRTVAAHADKYSLTPEETTEYVGRAAAKRVHKVWNHRENAAQHLAEIFENDAFHEYLRTQIPRDDADLLIGHMWMFQGFEIPGTVEPVVDFFRSARTRDTLRRFETDTEETRFFRTPRDTLRKAVLEVFTTVSHFPYCSPSVQPVEDMPARITRDLTSLRETWEGFISGEQVVPNVFSSYAKGFNHREKEFPTDSWYAVIDSLVEMTDRATVSQAVAENWISQMDDAARARDIYSTLVREGKVDEVPVQYKRTTERDVFLQAVEAYEKSEFPGHQEAQEVAAAAASDGLKKELSRSVVAWFAKGKYEHVTAILERGTYCADTARPLFTTAVAAATESGDTNVLRAAMQLPPEVLALDDRRISGFAITYLSANP
ncbi:MAG: hypothetical protein OXR66_00945 [Candidatus Woesearchaeota archaeon]|nr:hypothetical protein [Candidatus Woesearchaeota archaeon]